MRVQSVPALEANAFKLQTEVLIDENYPWRAAFLAFAAALFFAFFAAFLLACEESIKTAPGGPEILDVSVELRAFAAPGARYFPGPASSGAAFARLKFPEPLVACGGR